MHKRTEAGLRLGPLALIICALACVFAACFAGQSEPHKSAKDSPGAETVNGNSKCYVCHPSLKTEEITTVHLAMDVTCDACHGPSVEHMHDEMLMTEPDLLFGRAEVQKMCSDPSCHPPGGDRTVYNFEDHKDPAAVHAFYKEWLGRTRPNGRAVSPDSVCTDCHGTHNLDKSTAGQSEEESGDWLALFNGRDLTGWQQSGSASWSAEKGRIIGKFLAPATGRSTPADRRGITASDLLTEALYEDYLLAVTFRAEWPVRAGIWLHHAESQPGPRIEILDGLPRSGAPSPEVAALTGSVWVPLLAPATGRRTPADRRGLKIDGFVLLNLRPDLLDRESWNTISVRVEAGRVQVWLNGEEIGAVRTPEPAKGRIGLHLEKQQGDRAGQIQVREVLVQLLNQPEKKLLTKSLSE